MMLVTGIQIVLVAIAAVALATLFARQSPAPLRVYARRTDPRRSAARRGYQGRYQGQGSCNGFDGRGRIR